MFEFSIRFFITSHPYGNSICITRVVQYSIGVVNRTIYCIWLIFAK